MILSGATTLYESYSFNSRDSCSFFRFRLCFHSAFRDCGAYTGYARTELLFSFSSSFWFSLYQNLFTSIFGRLRWSVLHSVSTKNLKPALDIVGSNRFSSSFLVQIQPYSYTSRLYRLGRYTGLLRLQLRAVSCLGKSRQVCRKPLIPISVVRNPRIGTERMSQ